MPIDMVRERAFPLREVPKIPWIRKALGRTVSIQTVYRWAQRGIAGEKLEHVQMAGQKVTTEEALLRFFQRLSVPTDPNSKTIDSATHTPKLEKMSQALDAAGF